MSKRWSLVANRAGARLFEVSDHGRVLELREEFGNAAGRLHDGDLEADRPGRAYDSVGGGRHAMEQEESASERVAQDFARRLAERLAAGRKANLLDEIILIAEARFLGRLRTALDEQTAALVSASLDRDLVHCTTAELGEYVTALLSPRKQS